MNKVNIYSLLNRHKDMPEEVIAKTCEQYLANLSLIKNRWAWFEGALRLNFHQLNARKQITSNIKGQANVALLKQLGLLGGENVHTDAVKANTDRRGSLC